MVIFSYTGSPQVIDSHCTLMSKNYVAHSITVICVTG